MLDILFGWRKASKCKKLIRRLQCRLKLLKNKRCSIARQLREDISQLIRYGHAQTAFDRVEQLYMDENILLVYELLDNFCEFILIHLSYIRKHKDCPNDISEAISSLIFASARFGDLPELPLLRKLFGDRYGQRFALVALELLPGNLVSCQLRDNLSIKSVSNEAKYKLVDEITRSCVPLAPLALEYHQKQIPVKENNGNQEQNRKYKESQLEEMQEDSSLENSCRMKEQDIYLDDIREVQSLNSKDGKDQRLFMFKSTVFLGKENGKRLREKTFSQETNVTRKHPKKMESKANLKKVIVDRPYCAPISSKKMEIEENNYVRAASMPVERAKESENDNILRSKSFPINPSSPHVHPKLPDYDELAAKFMALKKANLQKRNI